MTAELASMLRRAAVAHCEHEKGIGETDPSWPELYYCAAYALRLQVSDWLQQAMLASAATRRSLSCVTQSSRSRPSESTSRCLGGPSRSDHRGSRRR